MTEDEREELIYSLLAEFQASIGSTTDQQKYSFIAGARSALVTMEERRAHKVMTPDEYQAMKIQGWHEVCRDVDGFGGLGVRFIAAPSQS